MCLLKTIGAVLVIAVLAAGALYYLRPPSGTWVVDRQAMHEEGSDDLLSRIAEGLIPDVELTLADDGTFILLRDGTEILTGTWVLEDGRARFRTASGGESILGDADYGRPGRLTLELLGTRVVLKRQ